MPTAEDPRITVRLAKADREALTHTAKTLGISEGEVVRRGLKLLLTPEKQAKVEELRQDLERGEGTGAFTLDGVST